MFDQGVLMRQQVPAVSVCVPAYQAGPLLGATIGSVLTQNFTDFELVVLDNASTDGTAELVDSFGDPRIRLVRNENTVPMTENWNRAVSHTRGRFVKLLCADDLLRPDCLRVQHQILTTAPQVALTACRRDFVDEDGRRLATGHGLPGLLGEHSQVAVARRVIRHGGNPIGEPGSVLFRRKDFDQAGGFAAELDLIMDIQLWPRLLAYGSLFGTPDSLAVFRVGGGSVSGRSHRKVYRQQHACNTQLAGNPSYRVRGADRLVGRAAAPLRLLRRRALFGLAALATRG
jgi:glycosyltransferase involved in cell wall biosynthesis